MKLKYFASAAAAVAFGIASPAFAGQTFDAGFVYGELGGVKSEGFTFSAAGNKQYEGAFGAQLDGTYTDIESEKTYDVNLHLFHRTDSFLAGAFASYGEIVDDRAWQLGAETQFYGSQMTVTGRAGFGMVDGGATDNEITNIALGADFYLSDNISLGVVGGYTRIKGLGDGTTFGVRGEYMLGNSTSFFLTVSRDDATPDNTIGVLGVRWNFGAASLRERDQKGPIR